MISDTPPMSNNERQRRFRKSHPGYYRKYYARKKAAYEAGLMRQRLELEAQNLALAQTAPPSPAPAPAGPVPSAASAAA